MSKTPNVTKNDLNLPDKVSYKRTVSENFLSLPVAHSKVTELSRDFLSMIDARANFLLKKKLLIVSGSREDFSVNLNLFSDYASHSQIDRYVLAR